MKKTLTSLLKLGLLLALGRPAVAQTIFTPVGPTGYTADVMAEGSGPVNQRATLPMDTGVPNVRWCYPVVGYTNPAGLSPTSGLPANGIITSVQTPGLTFQLGAYGGNNSLRIPGTGTGTLTLPTNNFSTTDVYVLAACGNGDSPVTFTVTFTDGTTQVFTNTVNDWFNGVNYAIQGTGRVNFDTNAIDNNATNPRMYEVRLVLLPSNWTKRVGSVTFSQTSTFATTPVLNVMGVTLGQACALPVGLVTASATTICPNAPVQLGLLLATPGGGFTGQWQESTDNGVTWTNVAGSATGNTLQVTPAVTTRYRYRAACGTAFALLGPVTVTVQLPPTSLAYAQSSFCQIPTSVAPTFAPAGGTFSSAPGLVVDPNTGVITPDSSTPGTYTVTYRQPASCQPVSTATVTVLPTPTLTLTYAASPFCQGGTNPAPTATPGGGSFSSTAGLVLDAATGVINAAASTPGTYTVRYAVTSPCPTEKTTQVVLLPVPVPTLTYPAPAICQRDASLLPAFAPAGGSFRSTAGLSVNAGTGAVAPGSSTPGTYIITYTSPGPCPATATATLLVRPTTVPTLAYDRPEYCKAGAAPVVTAQPAGGTFSGTGGLALDARTGSIDLSRTPTGSYTVTYRSADECPGQATATVLIKGNAAPVYPTVLTPNGDGKNDMLQLRLADVQNYSLQVYSRWGRQLWDTHDPAQGWDPATYSAGTYFYLLDYLDCAGNQQHVKSWIDVIK